MNENHDFSVYSKGFGLENILNGDSIICKFGDEFKIDSKVFVRPVKDRKSFTGKVFNRFEWAQEMVDKYKPVDSFVIDLALIEDQTFKVVEINCINSSGFCANNISKLIDSLLVYDTEN